MQRISSFLISSGTTLRRQAGRLAGGLLLASLLAAGCSSAPKEKSVAGSKAVGGTDEQIFLGDTIEKNYDPNVIMKRGEAFFEKEEYAEALVEYNHFLDLHKTHVLAPYAAFRIGESHFKMAKSIDRDPEPLTKAITALERMRKDFPGSRYDVQAQQKIQECHDWLAQMHLFVGQFYYRRESYLAAAHRFEQIMKIYPDKPVDPDALDAWREGEPPRLLFPNARYFVGADAWQRACHPHPRDRASFIPGMTDLLQASGRLEIVHGDAHPYFADALRFHHSDGHTPGLLLAELRGLHDHGGVVFCADLIPGRPWVHLPVTMGYDRYPELLIEEKREFLADKLARGVRLFFTHDAQCALARVTCDDKGRYGTDHEVAELHARPLAA